MIATSTEVTRRLLNLRSKDSGRDCWASNWGAVMEANTNATLVSHKRTPRRRNWWKVGFFVALLAFEFTRELLVLTEAQGATPNAMAHVFSYDGFVTVQGSWKRIDGGGSLVPGTVTIECRRETGQCVEASTMINDEFVHAPDQSPIATRKHTLRNSLLVRQVFLRTLGETSRRLSS